jgi:putative ABC transport system permease protein
MAITTLIAILGMLDSFLVTIDDGEAEFLQDSPDRLIVVLNNFYPVNSPQIREIQSSEALAVAEPGILIGGELRREDASFDVSLELIDLDSDLWTPTLVKGDYPSAEHPGILIAQKAADDLAVEPGDRVLLRHPRREGLFAVRMVETEIEVTGIHASPLRFQSFLSLEQADLMGLTGLANMLYVNPAEDYTQHDVQRAMFEQPGVASVRAISLFTELMRDMMDLFIGFMTIVAVAVLALAFLIAFNSTSINLDERSREVATLFAFGLPIRTVTRMAMVENLITGLLGTAVGLVFGWLALSWMMTGRVEEMMPDAHLAITVAPLSLALALIFGVVVVALTPLLTIRRMARMDLPATLRVME